MRSSIAERLSTWYCRNNDVHSTVRITSNVYRLVPEGREPSSRLVVAEFNCVDGSARVKRTLQSEDLNARAP